MAIEAFCPNGHKILCPEDRAGRTAKCPKCSAPFRIPEPPPNGRQQPSNALVATPTEPTTPDVPATMTTSVGSSDVTTSAATAAPAVPRSDSERSRAVSTTADGAEDDLATSAAVLTSGSGPSHMGLQTDELGAPDGGSGSRQRGHEWEELSRPTSERELIIFLCPNGHKLNGPKRLAGKVGKCPHCGAKFQIPFPDEEEPREDDELEDTVTEDPLNDYSAVSPRETDDSDYYRVQRFEESNTPAELESLFEAVRADTGSSVLSRIAGKSGKAKKAGESALKPPIPPPLPASPQASKSNQSDVHPLAELVARLWSEREHGGVIELHLNGGVLLMPEWFDEKLSGSTHGLFAAQAADGTVTMTVVPWDEVTRVVVRGVVGLPDGMFE